jgi:glycosyltransferase involved in cell wall biosynthesis
MVQRAIKSIINQQFPDWELILVNDGCAEEDTPRIMKKFAETDPRIKVVDQENLNRVYALNNGMEHATGEWICWLDCDDEYSSHYLRAIDAAIKDFPDYKIFNFGALVYWEDHRSTIRPTFYPREEGPGHEWFRAGHIGAGSFVFRRDLWNSDPKYKMPNEVNPYQFAAASKFDLKLDPIADEFQYHNTENPEGAFKDGIYRHGLSLGNPWGQDMLQFYLLTRDNFSKPLDTLLYIQYPRAHEERFENFGEIYPTNSPQAGEGG